MDDSMDSNNWFNCGKKQAQVAFKLCEGIRKYSCTIQSIGNEFRWTFTSKISRIWWLVMDNVFTFKSHNVEEFKVIKQLKELLQWIATLFDPLGLLSPFIIRSEMLTQEVWRCGLDWDDTIHEKLSVKMKS